MKSESQLQNQLKVVRVRLSLSQQALALAAGVTRQTISGIEAGLYAPSAAVALRLARALGCPVEELFWLEGDLPTIEATPVGPLPATPSLRVALTQIGGRWLARPLLADTAFRSEMVPADGIGTLHSTLPGTPPDTPTDAADKMRVQLLDDADKLARTVVVGGCAPVFSLWTRSAERWYPGLRVHWAHANSTAALHSLARGELHIAGLHLSGANDEDNRTHIQQLLPGRAVVLVHFGVWKEGLLLSSDNPKRITKVADLARKKVRLINREAGAGARLLLDNELSAAGLSATAVQGYGDEVLTHQEVARAVLHGRADVGVSTAAIAAAYGLSFLPLRAVRYDLAILQEHFQHEPVQQLLGTLDHRWVRSQLRVSGGYDTTQTGEVTVVN